MKSCRVNRYHPATKTVKLPYFHDTNNNTSTTKVYNTGHR